MSPDLDTLLHRTAPEPSHALDVDDLLARARRRRRRAHLAAGMAVLSAVAVLAGALVIPPRTSVIFDDTDVPDAADAPPESQPPSPSGEPGVPPTGSVTPLPPPPIEGRQDAVAAWTGDEVLVWGGWFAAEMGAHPDQTFSGWLHPNDGTDRIELGEVHFDDGAAYDPVSGTWRSIAPAPFTGGYGDRAVWTGKELLVWSSQEDRLASYDPADDAWSPLPDPPEPSGNKPDVTIVWTGTEAVLWGGRNHQPELPAFGAAFDPATRTWRRLPEAPVPPREMHTATWTGEEMIVWGGTDFVGLMGAELGGAAYDPAADTWRRLPLAPIGGRQGHAAAWSGAEVLVWGGGPTRGLAYDPADDAWRVLASPAPVGSGENTIAMWTGEVLLVWSGRPDLYASDTAVYDPEADAWHALPQSQLSSRCRAATAWTGSALFAWSGSPGCDVGMPPSDGALIVPFATGLDERVRADALAEHRLLQERVAAMQGLPEGCRVLPEGERHVSERGVVGATLGPTLLEGIRDGYETGPLVAILADEPDFERPWHVIAAVVTDADGLRLGTATWLSPHAQAAYAGGASTDVFGAWRDDPAQDPAATHLYAADDLAELTSIWLRTDQQTTALAAARACAERLTAP